MSRPGVTKQEVFAAANQLLGEGRAPTIEQIRHLLKTGSNSTIAAHLRDWRSVQGDTQTLAINEGLPHDIVSIVKGLWDRLSAQAGLKVDEVETNALQAISEVHQELEKYKKNNQRWQRLFIQWQEERKRLMDDKLQLNYTIEVLTTKNKVQKELIQEKRIRIEELHRIFAEMKNGAEIYTQQFEQQKQLQQKEISHKDSQLLKINDQLVEERYQHELLQDVYANLAFNSKEQNQKVIDLELKMIELEKTNYYLQKECENTKRLLEQTTTQLIDSKSETKSFCAQLLDAKKLLNDLTENHKVNFEELAVSEA